MYYDPASLTLVAVGLILIMAGAIAITSFGQRYPLTVLCAFLAALAVYVSVILVRIGVLSLPW